METNKSYHIVRIKENDGSFLVLLRNWERPEFYMHEIEKELSTFNKITKIYFDLLLKNGPKDRFYSACFNNGKFDSRSFRKVKSLNSNVLKEADTYFRLNFELIQKSYLTKAQKFILKKKLEVNL